MVSSNHSSHPQSIPVKILWLMSVGLFIYLLDIFAVGFLLHDTPLMDFQSYYYAAVAYAQQQNIYDSARLLELSQTQGIQQHTYPYLYPPTLAFYLQGFSHLTAIQASALFLALSHIISIIIIFLTLKLSLHYVRHTRPNRPFQINKTVYLLLAISCLTVPFHNNLQIGQINLLVLLNIILCFYASEVETKPILAGAFIAIATAIKITPVGLLVYFLFKKRFRVIASFLAVITLINLPLFFDDFSRQMWLSFFQQTQSTLSGSVQGLSDVIDFQNFALFEVFHRILGKSALSTFIVLIIIACMGISLAAASFKLRHSQQALLLLLPYSIVMIIISPVTYTHHLIYLFPGLMLLLLAYYFSTTCHKKHLYSFALLAFISCLDFPFYFKGLAVHNPVILGINSYGLIALFGYSLFLIQRICSPQVKG